eukprot:TRINITY_DN190_c1_g1_i1.p1 TRINITY_DN190_c1_g1~~TRINITY_DN190_c1_g1_i1.p1  ORF type:complete len:548 (-),score=110.80 TRINITY_DN190_c1_g1_i1:67-1710(-)
MGNKDWLTQKVDDDLKKDEKRRKAMDPEFNLITNWSKFENLALVSAVGAEKEVPQCFETCEWMKDRNFEQPHVLLREHLKLEFNLRILHVRRALRNFFSNIDPTANPIEKLVDSATLSRILYVCMSVEPLPEATRDPAKAVQTVLKTNGHTDFTPGLVKLLGGSGTICRATMMEKALTLLKDTFLKPDEEEVDTTEKKSIVAPVTSYYYNNRRRRHHAGRRTDRPIQILEVPGAARFRVSVTAAQSLGNLCSTAYVTLFRDALGENTITTFTVSAYGGENSTMVEGERCYYCVESTSYYQGCVTAEVQMNVTPITAMKEMILQFTEEQIEKGTPRFALFFLSALFRAQAEGVCDVDDFAQLLIRLLESLEFCQDSDTAQEACRVASRIFNQLPDLKLDMTSPVIGKIKLMINQLETAHEDLRCHGLRDWGSTKLPGAHLQTLLEMLLAAKTALKAPATKKHRTAIYDKNVRDFWNSLDLDAEQILPINVLAEALKAVRLPALEEAEKKKGTDESKEADIVIGALGGDDKQADIVIGPIGGDDKKKPT